MSTIFVVSGAFADPDIAPSASTADCKYAPLETYTGTSNLQADWSANEINLRWYNNNTLMDVDTASADCTYDGTLTPPTAPSRTGYTFKGWRVRPTYDFTTLPTSVNGTERWARDGFDNNEVCWHLSMSASAEVDDYESCADSMYNEIEQHEWKVRFSWGDIYGSAHCSAKIGNSNNFTWDNASSNWRASYNELESASGEKKFCWCQATGYKPSNSNTLYGANMSSSWFFGGGIYQTFSACSLRCAYNCATSVSSFTKFRKAVFLVEQ